MPTIGGVDPDFTDLTTATQILEYAPYGMQL
jgi:hypothetical protein